MAEQRKETGPETGQTEQNRDPRELDSRAADARPSDAWIPASILPVPPEEPGYTFHWVRTSIFEKPDMKNVSQKFREGWVPVKLKDYPNMQVQSDIDTRFDGNIEVGGLLLCKAPTEWVERRRAYFASRAEAQMEAVDEGFMREKDSRMPKFKDRHTRTTFGSG